MQVQKNVMMMVTEKVHVKTRVNVEVKVIVKGKNKVMVDFKVKEENQVKKIVYLPG